MKENRGRKPNMGYTVRVKELTDEGKNTNEIADVLGITSAMVRYYKRQEYIGDGQKRESLTACFFRQPREVQERIASEIGYALPQSGTTTPEDFEKQYRMAKGEPEDNGLMTRCISFLDGRIKGNEVNENFTTDEMERLSTIPEFMEKSKEIFGGKKSKHTREQVIDKLKENGI